MKRELTERFLLRLMIGAVPLGFFVAALFSRGESGNSGMSVNLEKFVPMIFFVAWEAFLIVEALILFAKQLNRKGLISTYAACSLGVIFIISLYVNHQY
ncbi:hypothetical protein [Pedobacter agri]|uniref:hypothetical protein n=1 Tax=Pedobacter agri TaxID=454586 RepID=UPI00292E7EAF|nr:hypothetical protein [Pedobacter agri]